MKKYFSLLLIAGLLASCNQQQTTSSKLSVAASFYPLAFLAQQIGDGLATVTQVTPGGVEPHEYEPTAQELADVQNAKIFLMNGGGVDGWGDKVIDELKQKGIIAVRMTDSITPMGGFSETGENANATDPHLWLDPVNVQQEAQLIRDAFIEADPAHADAYTKNANALIAKLKDLDAEYRKDLAQCAVKDVVTSHNAFRYLAKEYDFNTIAISGLSPDEEPSAKRLAEISDFAKKNNIKYIFFETLLSPKLSETIASEIGAQPLVLNPLEGLTPDDVTKGADYFSIMRDNLKNLRTAMQCQ